MLSADELRQKITHSNISHFDRIKVANTHWTPGLLSISALLRMSTHGPGISFPLAESVEQWWKSWDTENSLIRNGPSFELDAPAAPPTPV